MTIVLVHGVPETDRVWDLVSLRLVEAGHDDQVRLSPPGLGAAVPAGFGATVVEYRDWLITELEGMDEPVDLVGHDLGGVIAALVAIDRPDLIRTWTSDVLGLFDPDYVWHTWAKMWRTRIIGEVSLATFRSLPVSRRAAPYISNGMEPDIARAVAAGFDASMARCIVRIYRSVRQPAMSELGANLESAASRPGLFILSEDDHMVGTDEQRTRSAGRAGARVERLTGCGHWWMTHDDGRPGADALTRFWADDVSSRPDRT